MKHSGFHDSVPTVLNQEGVVIIIKFGAYKAMIFHREHIADNHIDSDYQIDN